MTFKFKLIEYETHSFHRLLHTRKFSVKEEVGHIIGLVELYSFLLLVVDLDVNEFRSDGPLEVSGLKVKSHKALRLLSLSRVSIDPLIELLGHL
jgi:hypothetical protein